MDEHQLQPLRDLFQYWLDWNQEQREREGLESNDDCNVIQVPPHWPTRGSIRAWIRTLDRAMQPDSAGNDNGN